MNKLCSSSIPLTKPAYIHAFAMLSNFNLLELLSGFDCDGLHTANNRTHVTLTVTQEETLAGSVHFAQSKGCTSSIITLITGTLCVSVATKPSLQQPGGEQQGVENISCSRLGGQGRWPQDSHRSNLILSAHQVHIKTWEERLKSIKKKVRKKSNPEYFLNLS